jgi:hypothetical protein
VAIHFFSKRVADQPEKTKILLHVVEPYLEEKQKDFVKGVGIENNWQAPPRHFGGLYEKTS